MQFISSIALAAALMSAPAAVAQTAPQTAPQATLEPSAPAPVTDAEVTQFATAAVAAGKINNDTTIAADAKTAQIVAAITATGLTAERFNEIAKMLPADPALNKRVTDAAAAQAPAAQ
ncbi:MAG: DUF4168 domain-containing protein [Sphingomonas sp.]|uniref:DUF4168 domain-containing protein n=1 Tax=Sphingomonas sp. TaxID=28214 RepID=UPI0025E294CE|nr:DUF4168 domain-containing protein [Sphingomonas sp.]MBX3563163.1 DUF4168 domain-containing protein [Sphingomonas sp.]